MKKRLLLYIILILPQLISAQENSSALFIKNEGQWKGDFHYQLRLNFGAIYFEEDGLSILLRETHSENGEHDHPHQNQNLKQHALKIEFLNSHKAEIKPLQKAAFHHNYFLGNDPSQWYSRVGVYAGLNYQNIYDGIHIRYFQKEESLKYDIEVEAGTDPSTIKMHYKGADKIYLKENELHIKTSAGELRELIPETYQIINGEKILVKCSYTLKESVVGFLPEDYDTNHSLIIDPQLVFSSFSGSTSDNWGFTATYDNSGNLYGAGIVFNDGGSYPTTPGAIKSGFSSGSSSDIDIAISKFSADGSQLLFSTYLGGTNVDVPHSLVVDDNDNLYLLGNSGSADFPVDPSAYQSNYAGGPTQGTQSFAYTDGSDIIICRISSDGTNLMASTFLGGNKLDGVNLNIYKNYGDHSRGEILYHNNNVFIISNTQSDSIALNNAYKNNLSGPQDALIASFTADLKNMNWGTYFGGSSDESGYSIKINSNNEVVFAGSTSSTDLPTGTQSLKQNLSGAMDGYIGKLSASGTLNALSYMGGNADDQVFFIDLDRNGMVYSFGQTTGNILISPDQYSNPNSRQFLKKISPDLSTEHWSTQIGSGLNKSDLVPTAFMVDDCFNIYLSGWNGSSNRITLGGTPIGNTLSLPTSPDAYQSNTDGSDFYFMVLNRNAEMLLYASYFGGNSAEHVDGGTSRFDPDGTIYQAVCAGCGQQSFPTTPGVVSPTNNSNNCNLGVIKLHFDAGVKAVPAIDYSLNVDTVCDSLLVKFENNSINADLYYWEFGNGLSSTDTTPSTYYHAFGVYEIMLIASDTTCGLTDTTFLTLEHDSGVSPVSLFNTNYLGCDNSYTVNFENKSKGAHSFLWDFGDGSSDTAYAPAYQYADSGQYIITLTAIDTICNKFQEYTDTVSFRDSTNMPTVYTEVADCSDGSVKVFLENDRKRFSYFWEFGNGENSNQHLPEFYYDEPGKYLIKLSIFDTVCNKEMQKEFEVEINEIGTETFIPNAFTPNGDGLNEELELFGNNCTIGSYFIIFNRWGEVVFETDRPFEKFWNALQNGTPAPQGVYSYSLVQGDKVFKGTVHLVR